MAATVRVRSASDDESSARDVVGEDEAGLGGNRLIGSGPGGAGFRRDDRESMAVRKPCGEQGECLETRWSIPARNGQPERLWSSTREIWSGNS